MWLVALGFVLVTLSARQLRADAPPADALPNTRAEWEARVRADAERIGVPPRLALAIVDTENPDWNTAAVNQGPGDRERGGAWGLFQLTARTARDTDDAHGGAWKAASPERPAADLADPRLALRLSLRHMRDLVDVAARLFPVGTFEHAREVASRWNSGRASALAPERTRTEYLPRFERRYRAREGVA